MKQQVQTLTATFEGHAQQTESGVEYWLARDLQLLLGYGKWDNFQGVISKAKTACEVSGHAISDHFADVGKMVVLGSGSKREIDDVMLTRYACYLIAQNGDSRKAAIAFAQTYFAMQTRKAELIEQRLLEAERVQARQKLSTTEKELSTVIFEQTGGNQNFALIRSKGDTALFGRNTQAMKASFKSAVQAISSTQQSIPWKFTSLAEQIIEECVWPTGGTAAKPNVDIWGGRAENDVGHCLNLIARIKAMVANPNLKWLLDVDPSIQTIPDIIEKFCLSSEGRIIRLDLSAIPFEANAREILVNAIGRKLLSCAREGDINYDKPLLVFIDEAHQFLNKKIGDETSSFALDSFGNIAKEGRKYGLNVVIATQRPRDVPEDVLSQIGTLIVHRLTNEKDQEVVKKAVGSIDQRSASFLPVLGQGEALLLGVDFPFPMTVKIKTPQNKPESRSASFSSVWPMNAPKLQKEYSAQPLIICNQRTAYVE